MNDKVVVWSDGTKAWHLLGKFVSDNHAEEIFAVVKEQATDLDPKQTSFEDWKAIHKTIDYPLAEFDDNVGKLGLLYFAEVDRRILELLPEIEADCRL